MINDCDASKQSSETYPIQRTISKDSASGTAAVAPPSKLAPEPGVDTSREPRNDAGIIAAAAHAAVPDWANMALMVLLIFGGCCTNVSAHSGRGDGTG